MFARKSIEAQADIITGEMAGKGAVAALVLVLVVAVGGVYLYIQQPRAKLFSLVAREFGFDGGTGGPTIKVKAGDTVRITIKNEGGVIHEFIVVSESDRDTAGALPAFTGASSGDLKPGEAKTIEFRVNRAGNFFYVCHRTEPGNLLHSLRQMFGQFVVEP